MSTYFFIQKNKNKKHILNKRIILQPIIMTRFSSLFFSFFEFIRVPWGTLTRKTLCGSNGTSRSHVLKMLKQLFKGNMDNKVVRTTYNHFPEFLLAWLVYRKCEQWKSNTPTPDQDATKFKKERKKKKNWSMLLYIL